MLRAAADHDADAILRWRNHLDVRRRYLHQEEICPDQHRRWWNLVSTSASYRVLIYETNDGAPSGAVIFRDYDPHARSAEWGFFLDIDGLSARRSLVPAWIGLEREAIGYAFGELDLDVLSGRTLATNTSVLELHRRCGFLEIDDRRQTVVINGEPHDVVWIELRRRAWADTRAPRR